jgi:hypothetical protein
VFYSEKEIPHGKVWEQEIDEGLEKCDIFLFIGTPEALESPRVAKEVRDAKRLNKFIIPCRHITINWLDLKKLGLDSIQGVDFDTPNQIIRELGRQPKKGLAAQSQRSTPKNTEQYETGIMKTSTTSKRWLAREIKERLDDASELERLMMHISPPSIAVWMLEAESFLKESFGENSRYYQLFPKFTHTMVGGRIGGVYDTKHFNDAKEQLLDILQDIQEEEAKNNNN